jgi:hypothetical protein
MDDFSMVIIRLLERRWTVDDVPVTLLAVYVLIS